MVETQYMPGIRAAWARRVAALELKPGSKAKELEMFAFADGVLAALVGTGAMTKERGDMIDFLAYVGRLEEWLEPKPQPQQVKEEAR